MEATKTDKLDFHLAQISSTPPNMFLAIFNNWQVHHLLQSWPELYALTYVPSVKFIAYKRT